MSFDQECFRFTTNPAEIVPDSAQARSTGWSFNFSNKLLSLEQGDRITDSILASDKRIFLYNTLLFFLSSFKNLDLFIIILQSCLIKVNLSSLDILLLLKVLELLSIICSTQQLELLHLIGLSESICLNDLLPHNIK